MTHFIYVKEKNNWNTRLPTNEKKKKKKTEAFHDYEGKWENEDNVIH